MLRIRAEKIGLRGAVAVVSFNGESFGYANVASFLLDGSSTGDRSNFECLYFASFMNETRRERERERERSVDRPNKVEGIELNAYYLTAGLERILKRPAQHLSPRPRYPECRRSTSVHTH